MGDFSGHVSGIWTAPFVLAAIAVVFLGTAFVAAASAWLAHWALKALLENMGLWVQFVIWAAERRRAKKKGK